MAMSIRGTGYTFALHGGGDGREVEWQGFAEWETLKKCRTEMSASVGLSVGTSECVLTEPRLWYHKRTYI